MSLVGWDKMSDKWRKILLFLLVFFVWFGFFLQDASAYIVDFPAYEAISIAETDNSNYCIWAKFVLSTTTPWSIYIPKNSTITDAKIFGFVKQDNATTDDVNIDRIASQTWTDDDNKSTIVLLPFLLDEKVQETDVWRVNNRYEYVDGLTTQVKNTVDYEDQNYSVRIGMSDVPCPSNHILWKDENLTSSSQPLYLGALDSTSEKRLDGLTGNQNLFVRIDYDMNLENVERVSIADSFVMEDHTLYLTPNYRTWIKFPIVDFPAYIDVFTAAKVYLYSSLDNDDDDLITHVIPSESWEDDDNACDIISLSVNAASVHSFTGKWTSAPGWDYIDLNEEITAVYNDQNDYFSIRINDPDSNSDINSDCEADTTVSNDPLIIGNAGNMLQQEWDGNKGGGQYAAYLYIEMENEIKPIVDVNTPAPGDDFNIGDVVDINLFLDREDTKAVTVDIYYSSSPLSFTNQIAKLSTAEGTTVWSCNSTGESAYDLKCSYDWNTSGVSAGDYFIDINAWNSEDENTMDSSGYTSDQNFTLSEEQIISITLKHDTVSFGTVFVGSAYNSESNNNAFDIENTGNVDVNVYIYADSSLFAETPGTSANYQAKSSAIEPGSASEYRTSYINLPIGEENKVWIVRGFESDDSNDFVRVDINILVPWNEDPGDKSSTVYFVASSP